MEAADGLSGWVWLGRKKEKCSGIWQRPLLLPPPPFSPLKRRRAASKIIFPFPPFFQQYSAKREKGGDRWQITSYPPSSSLPTKKEYEKKGCFGEGGGTFIWNTGKKKKACRATACFQEGGGKNRNMSLSSLFLFFSHIDRR